MTRRQKAKSVISALTRKADWRSEWEGRQAAFVASTWVYMMRDMSSTPLYAYVKPTSGAAWGELLAVRQGEKAPDGYTLVTGERIPAGDKQTIARWLDRYAGGLPVIPANL